MSAQTATGMRCARRGRKGRAFLMKTVIRREYIAADDLRHRNIRRKQKKRPDTGKGY